MNNVLSIYDRTFYPFNVFVVSLPLLSPTNHTFYQHIMNKTGWECTELSISISYQQLTTLDIIKQTMNHSFQVTIKNYIYDLF